MFTFEVDQVSLVKEKSLVLLPAEKSWDWALTTTISPGSWSARSQEVENGAVLLGCSQGNLLSYKASLNPLISAVGLAYNHHHPLSLSPSAIWMAIAQGFSTWISQNSDLVRKQFVDFKGKVKIELEVPENPNWPVVLAEFSEKISSFTGKKRNLFVADFSTSSLEEKAASEVVLMYGMSKYFDYGMRTMCGFPRITLEGSVEDWERIHDRVRVLGEISAVAKDTHMKNWIDTLLPILDEFVFTVKGSPDKDFWKCFYHLNGGSGGPYVGGHVINLFPYLSYEGRPIQNKYLGVTKATFGGITPNGFDRGVSKVDVTWNYYGAERKVHFYGGFVGVSMRDDFTLRPECGWSTIDVTNLKAEK